MLLLFHIMPICGVCLILPYLLVFIVTFVFFLFNTQSLKFVRANLKQILTAIKQLPRHYVPVMPGQSPLILFIFYGRKYIVLIIYHSKLSGRFL